MGFIRSITRAVSDTARTVGKVAEFGTKLALHTVLLPTELAIGAAEGVVKAGKSVFNEVFGTGKGHAAKARALPAFANSASNSLCRSPAALMTPGTFALMNMLAQQSAMQNGSRCLYNTLQTYNQSMQGQWQGVPQSQHNMALMAAYAQGYAMGQQAGIPPYSTFA